MSTKDIIKQLEREYPSFMKVINLWKFPDLIEFIDYCKEKGLVSSKDFKDEMIPRIKAHGLKEFASSIWFALYRKDTVGQIVSQIRLSYHDEFCDLLINKYTHKVIETLSGLYHGSHNLPLLAHVFYIYYFGRTYYCEFEKVFGGTRDLDIYIPEFDIAVEVTTKDTRCLNNNLPNRAIRSFISKAVSHLEGKIVRRNSTKFICAFSLNALYHQPLMEEMFRMVKDGTFKTEFYYLFHDPEAYLTPFLSNHKPSKIWFVRANGVDNIDGIIRRVFKDYKGCFRIVTLPI